jgi:NAD(P)-dependent dehydrogenase (short-subunit alcohol dehydrogenase family)
VIQFPAENLVLVTGASSGIGKAVALKLNELGATVIGMSRNAESLQEVKESAAQPDHFHLEPIDLTEEINNLPKVMKGLAREYGKLSGLVYSAGVTQMTPLKGLTEAKSKDLFDLNYFAGLMLGKGFADRRVRQEGETAMVYISSILAVIGSVSTLNYAASKGAINSMVKSMALELAPLRVRVNCVSPGYVETEMTTKISHLYSDEFKNELETMYPLGHGKPEDIANSVSFLLSKQARWVTGQNLIVDGGRSII